MLAVLKEAAIIVAMEDLRENRIIIENMMSMTFDHSGDSEGTTLRVTW
jgi:hypothetical protein